LPSHEEWCLVNGVSVLRSCRNYFRRQNWFRIESSSLH